MTASEQTRQHAPKPCGCGSGHAGAAPCGCWSDTTAPGEIITERNHYFTGKFMTARDFAHEQAYHRSHHQLHNRLLHGWGIVCGLKVVPHPNDDCRDRWVVVEPGIAIDCYGRELVLEQKIAVKIWDPPSDQAPGSVDHGPFLLSICYHDRPVELVPTLYAEGACGPSGQDYNRVREDIQWDVRLFTQAERDAGCWHGADQDDDSAKSEAALKARCKPCGGEDTREDCITPVCICHGMIPLALIKPKKITGDEHHRYAIGKRAIDQKGRHYVRGAALTHIIGYNWRHGEKMKLSELDGHMERKLKIFFDHEILPSERGTGINRSTFRVEYREPNEEGTRYSTALLLNDAEIDGNDVGRPFLEDKCVAVFPIPDAYIKGRVKFETQGVVHITLKCDFILDCNGRAVDGDHLGARMPTGDGVEGGIFESWFFIEDDLPKGSRKPGEF